jgi:para-nitrobenzyl esterase
MMAPRTKGRIMTAQTNIDERPVLRNGEPVAVDGGLVSGAADGGVAAATVFRGIPYAAPPLGPLRWCPPAPVASWQGVRPATAFGAPAPQGEMATISVFAPPPSRPVSEDCLTLNIWTPAEAPGDRLPVMVFIHGGGFRIGAGSLAGYDGAPLAAEGAVVVTFNYRLNVLGAFAHPALSAESEFGASGNYGLLDQVALLHWLQRNIAGFGGDPDRVTLFGESAGARAITLHTVSPLADGLFHRGVCQSGALRNVSIPLAEREALGVEIAEALGCAGPDVAERLRQQPHAALLAAAAFDSNPIIDGYFMPEDPVVRYGAGRLNPVSLMIGANAEEGSLFLQPQAEALSTAAGFDAHMAAHYSDAASIADFYCPSAAADGYAAAVRHFTDRNFIGPARRHATFLAATGRPAYCYYFNRVPPGRIGDRYGCHHGAELAYVFGLGTQFGRPEPGAGEAEDRTLTRWIMGYWRRFAETGDPNGGDAPHWPIYDADRGRVMELGDQIEPVEWPRAAGLDMLAPFADLRAKL